MIQFNSLLEVLNKFNTEEKCVEYLALLRWGGKPICPHCGHDRVYTLKKGYKCAAKTCYKKFTVRVGTVFQESNIPLMKWFLAAYLLSAHKKGISSYQLGRDLGITQKTAWFMLHRLREANRIKLFEKTENIVEIDETFIGGKTANKHKWQRDELNKKGTGYVHKTPVLGILERGVGVRTFQVDKADGQTLQPIIMKHVNWGTQVVTDGFGGYKDLNKYYYHTIVNHGKEEFVVGDKHTNSLEGFWSLLKRGIYGIYHQVSEKHLARYCDEFTFRYNTKDLKDGVRFNISLLNVQGSRLPYKKLVNRS